MKRGHRYSRNNMRGGARVDPLFVPDTVPGRHPSELLRAEDVAVSKIVAVMVCVNFSDYLEQSLAVNTKLVDELVVVTSSKDLDTRNICEQYSNVICLVTECFYEDGCTFDKGKALNKALASIAQHIGTWVLITDADIVLPLNFKEYFKPRQLNTAVLYGAPRHFAYKRETYDRFVSSGSRNYSLLDAYYSPGNMPIGYFQFFNSLNLKRRGLTSPSAYPEGHNDASYSDLVFCKKFSTRTTLKQLHVIHLGEAGINHRGRVSPAFKAKSPPAKTARCTPFEYDPKDSTQSMLEKVLPGTEWSDDQAAMHDKVTGLYYEHCSTDKFFPVDHTSFYHLDSGVSDELAIICCFFNVSHKKNPLTNYKVFHKFASQQAMFVWKIIKDTRVF